MLMLRNPSQAISLRSCFEGIFPIRAALMANGEKRIEAIMNLIVARTTGDSVTSTVEAATKLKPQTVETNRAAMVPLSIFPVDFIMNMGMVYIYMPFLLFTSHLFVYLLICLTYV